MQNSNHQLLIDNPNYQKETHYVTYMLSSFQFDPTIKKNDRNFT